MTRFLGAVLAGGRSSRFGSDKALALVESRPLLDHAVAALRAVTPDIVVCGRPWSGLTSLTDRPAAGMGPLGAVNAALHHGRELGFDGVLTLACDTPFIDPATLLSLVGEGQNAAFIDSYPVIGFWPVRFANQLDAFLSDDGKHSLRGFARVANALPADCGAEIVNFNYARDLEAWLSGAKEPPA